jgi:alkylation response protein AidB-like acyl-CoA dehydrogenase
MDTPGISVAPVETVGGIRTNITFYDDVRVPDSCRVGDVDAGWSVMQAALVYERNAANWGEPAALVDAVARWAHQTGRLADPVVRDRVARHAIALEVGRLLSYRTSWLAAEGGMPMVEGSMAKLFLSEAFLTASGDLLDLFGHEGVLQHGEDSAPLGGLVEHAYRHAVVTTIYGGTSEIQRGIIAQRGLGLPRPR